MEKQQINHSTNSGSAGSDFEEVTIPVPWGVIAGKLWGPKNKQPILAIHGWQDNAGSFDNLAPLLAAHQISILCIDLPGHGYSSHFPKGMAYYLMWDGLHVIRRIVKHYNWNKVCIIGHSLGGCLAFMYAAMFPNDISSYISLDMASSAVRDITQYYPKMADLIDSFIKCDQLDPQKTPRYSYDALMEVVTDAYRDTCTKESCAILMKRGLHQNANGYAFTRDQKLKKMGLALIDFEQAMAMAKLIRCPVLNIKGDPGMKFEHPEWYSSILDEIEKHCSYLERVVVPGTHHFHLNNAKSIETLIVNFLRKDPLFSESNGI